jgi:hypothetical protein
MSLYGGCHNCDVRPSAESGRWLAPLDSGASCDGFGSALGITVGVCKIDHNYCAQRPINQFVRWELTRSMRLV